MLATAKQPRPWFSYDNWGANPSGSIGTSVANGTSNALGSWVQVASGANIAQDVYSFLVQVHTGNANTAVRLQMLDIGVDPAGGTSYTSIISNMVMGGSATLIQPGLRQFFFPFFIKAGSSVAVRIRGASGSAGNTTVAIKFWGLRRNPVSSRVGTFSETLGATTGTTSGTAFTPGNAAGGSWADLGATTRDMWWWQLGYQINDTTTSAQYTYIDLAFGDASNKHLIHRVMHVGTSNESSGLALQTHLLGIGSYCPVKAGEHIYVRGRCSGNPDSSYQATVTGIGG